MNRYSNGLVRRARYDESGQVLPLVALMMIMLLGLAGFVIDFGRIYVGLRQLQASADASALAGAEGLLRGTAVSTATLYSGLSGDKNATAYLTGVSMASGYPKVECLSTLTGLGIPCTGANSANAVQVKEEALLPLVFGGIVGTKSVTLSAMSTASGRGAAPGPFNIMMVLDATDSMRTETDSNCTVPGIRGSPTAEECAQYGVQQLLDQLDPCPAGYSATHGNCGSVTAGNVANPVDQVGLMVFPGLTPSETTSLSSPPVPATGATQDYSCPPRTPTSVPYNENPGYLILGFQSDYRTSDSSTTLNGGSGKSNLVNAVGAGVGSCPGVIAEGGQGTFYAGAIAAAQSYLTTNSRPNVQNVMILLSDGNASASATQMSGTATRYTATAECQQAVSAATTAKAAGILIYSVSYGSETSGCTAGDSLTPCQTMENIASLPVDQYFFSVQQGGHGIKCTGGRPITSLNNVFTDIYSDLTFARLIPNNTP